MLEAKLPPSCFSAVSIGGVLQEYLPYDGVCEVFIPTLTDTELIMDEVSPEPGEERVCSDTFPDLERKLLHCKMFLGVARKLCHCQCVWRQLQCSQCMFRERR